MPVISQAALGDSGRSQPLAECDRCAVIDFYSQELQGQRNNISFPGSLMSLPIILLRERLWEEHGLVLNIEIARPGTWKAVGDHLKMRGPGFFDFVHFDVHGSVNKVDNRSAILWNSSLRT